MEVVDGGHITLGNTTIGTTLTPAIRRAPMA